MATLSELIAQKEALEQKIKEIRKAERKDAIKKARQIIQEFDLTADELYVEVNSHAVVPKYSNPQTGEAWSGRGRTPKWLVGKNKKDYLILK